MKGLIINSISGVYYVKTENKIYESKPRGIFRKNNFRPVVGDICRISITKEGKGVIEEVYDRKNFMLRPPLANLDKLFFVVSTIDPKPNFLVLDQLISVAEKEKISSNIVITKIDLAPSADIEEIYSRIYPIFKINYADRRGIFEIENAMKGVVSAFSGNSGAGKSTLLNAIDKNLKIDTGEISSKLGRGKHTTRVVSLYQLENGGYIADTPGFSAVDFNKMSGIEPSEVDETFIEFRDYINGCRFNNCLHNKEIGCEVKKAVGEKKISECRYRNYLSIINQQKEIDFW